MVRILVFVFSGLLLPLSAHATPRDGAIDHRVLAGGEGLPVNLASYPSDVVAARLATEPAGERFATLREASLSFQEGVGGRKKGYEAVLFSLLIPGTGEIYLGYYWRGIALVGIEALAWYGYASYRDDGMDGRDAYEAYADANWDDDKWVVDHPVHNCLDSTTVVDHDYLTTVGNNPCGGWPGWHSYAPRDEQKQNYYENIGKYDWFISGWSDWDPVAQPMDTAVRDAYRAMRNESNDNLQTADRFIYLSMAARLFSVVETVFLVRRPRCLRGIRRRELG